MCYTLQVSLYQKAVFKSLRLITSLSVVSTALIAETTLSLPPPPPENQSVEAIQEALQVGAEVPICYMRTADGKVLDLTSLCKEQPGNLSAVSPAPRPYNASAIKKFDDELYGEGN